MSHSDNRRRVLEEESYVDVLSSIIERDYFPQMKRRKKELGEFLSDNRRTQIQNTQQEPAKGFCKHPDDRDELSQRESAEVSLTEFFNRFTSEDNASFEKLQQEACREMRKRYHWMYEDGDPQRKAGMLMLYYLNNGTTNPLILSARERIAMDNLIASSSHADSSDTRSNGVEGSKFRVRNQLMFPPQLSDSEDTCCIPKRLSINPLSNDQMLISSKHTAIASSSSSTARAGGRGNTKEFDRQEIKREPNLLISDDNLSSVVDVDQVMLKYNSRISLKGSNCHEFGSYGSISASRGIEGCIEEVSGKTSEMQNFLRQKIIQRRNTNFADSFTTFRLNLLDHESPLEAPHTPSIIGSENEIDENSSFTSCETHKAQVHLRSNQKFVLMSPLHHHFAPQEQDISTCLFTWGELISSPMMISSSSHIDGRPRQVGMNFCPQQKITEQAVGTAQCVPHFEMQPTRKRELIAHKLVKANYVAAPSQRPTDTSVKNNSCPAGVDRQLPKSKSVAERTAKLTPAAQSLLFKHRHFNNHFTTKRR